MDIGGILDTAWRWGRSRDKDVYDLTTTVNGRRQLLGRAMPGQFRVVEGAPLAAEEEIERFSEELLYHYGKSPYNRNMGLMLDLRQFGMLRNLSDRNQAYLWDTRDGPMVYPAHRWVGDAIEGRNFSTPNESTIFAPAVLVIKAAKLSEVATKIARSKFREELPTEGDYSHKGRIEIRNILGVGQQVLRVDSDITQPEDDKQYIEAAARILAYSWKCAILHSKNTMANKWGPNRGLTSVVIESPNESQYLSVSVGDIFDSPADVLLEKGSERRKQIRKWTVRMWNTANKGQYEAGDLRIIKSMCYSKPRGFCVPTPETYEKVDVYSSTYEPRA